MLTIRTATLKDTALLARIGAEMFSETFASENTPENMASYLAASFSPALQAAELTESDSLFLIAEIEGATAGYARLKAGSTETSVTGARPVELVRIYAGSRWLGPGVGAGLMQACLTEAARMGADGLWLGVWERNPRAIRFYQKWGVVQVGTHGFQLGDELQIDWIMQRPVTDFDA
jgi:ribosomal protein S18 acetylase RimI-like enzyme